MTYMERWGTMNRLFVVLVTVVVVLSALCEYGHARDGLRCGTRLVALGMSQDEVIVLCGEPSWASSWQEVLERGTLLNKKDFVRATVIVNFEEWTYNWGPTRFMSYLLFRNGVLDRIHSGGYGY
jgi:hypothetical protein